MKWTALTWALVVLAIGPAMPARAVPPGMTIEFDGQGEGKVTFEGAKHTGPGMHCSNCHLAIFDVSRSSQITKADHRTRQFCFVCHDGKTAFAARGRCERCHVEPEVPASPPPAAPTVSDAGTRPTFQPERLSCDPVESASTRRC